MGTTRRSLIPYLFDLAAQIRPDSPSAVVSVIGSGGKTTLIEALAEEGLTRSLRVLITTTTKLSHPRLHTYTVADTLALDTDRLPESGRCVLWGFSDGDKLIPGSSDVLSSCRTLFDLILIEADGSRGLPLKMHKADEPVIPHITTSTVQVFGLSALGGRKEQVIHRSELFHGGADTLDAGMLISCMKEPVRKKGKHLQLLNQADILTEETRNDLMRMIRDEQPHVLLGSLLTDTLYGEQERGKPA